MIAALLLGCQPGHVPAPDTCFSTAPTGPIADEVTCRDVLMGSDGRIGDFQLANPRLTALVRHPTASASAIGVGGGTVVDARAWVSPADHLLEAIPLVADGWLDVEAWELLEDGFRVEGAVRDLPDRPSTDWGAWREVTWRIDPELPVLRADGADGMYVHAGGPIVRYGTSLASDEVAYGVSGEVEDLGGAVRATVPELWVAPAHNPWAGRGVARMEGRTERADHVELLAGDVTLGRIPVLFGRYDFVVPPGVDGVRALASGCAPGPRVPIAVGTTLEPGACGGFTLLPAWGEARPQELGVTWVAADGPHRLQLGPEGGVVPIGPEPVEVAVTLRPDLAPLAFTATPGEVRLEPIRQAFDVGSRVLAAPTWPSARSRTWRGSNDDAVDAALAEGLDWVAMTPEDAVAPPLFDVPLLVRQGVLVQVDGHPVPSWSYTSRPRQPGWGAPDARGLAPVDALALLRATDNVVGLDLLGALGPPWGVDHPPDGVLLDRPDPDLANLAPWLAWLDAEAWLPPYGPRIWVEVADPAVLGFADVEQGLVRGQTCATTGPLLTIAVDGVGPGFYAPTRAEHAVSVGVHAPRPLDRLVLVGTGGEVLGEWSDVTDSIAVSTPHATWWIAIGWSGADWMVTGPVLGR
ncbi:MAG: hypothetical protein H6737_10605 [Alphaproteobacteria bacterium]|nr:hypothetical protein [Alphaproteobacteria bacterium]